MSGKLYDLGPQGKYGIDPSSMAAKSGSMDENAQNTAHRTNEYCSKIFIAGTLASLFCLAGAVFGFTAVAMYLLANPLAVKMAIACAACFTSSIVLQQCVNRCIVRQMHAIHAQHS